MENIFELPMPYDPIDESFGTQSFWEFSNIMDQLDHFGTKNLLVEAVHDTPVGAAKKISQIAQNTRQTTRDSMRLYGYAVNTDASVIKASWDLMMKSVTLMTKGISFIIMKAIEVPKALTSVLTKVERIPSDIARNIRGDIQLYITVDDLEVLYNQSLIARLDTFLTTLQALTQGDLWVTFFRKATSLNPVKMATEQNDMKLCRRLSDIYKGLEQIQFEKTTVKMSDPNVVATYFQTKKVIKFTDLHGVRHEDTYYEALQQLLKDIQSKKSTLETLQKDFGKRFHDNQANQDFAKLGVTSQNRLMTAMQETSKVVAIVGNIVRYVLTDIKTIDNSIKRILGAPSP